MMSYNNAFYTKQEQEDALVTAITNPNRVGSGFINLGPQKRFAPSTANWQASGGGAPMMQPLTDVLNAPRPSLPQGLPPPPAAQQMAPPPVAPKMPPPPVAQKIVPSDKDEVLAAPPTRKTKADMPPTANQQQAKHRGAKGKGDRPPAAGGKGKGAPAAGGKGKGRPAAVSAEEAAEQLAAQLAADEVLARQLAAQLDADEDLARQQEMLQHAPPEPVAALAEPRAEKAKPAKRVTPPPPASKTPAAPPEETAKRVRALRKKLRDIDQLEEKQSEGTVLQPEQLEKIAGKAAIVKELGALPCDTVDKEGGAPTGEATAGDTASKRVRVLRKKLRDIELLEDQQREGTVLEPNQLVKIAGKAAIVKELGALLV